MPFNLFYDSPYEWPCNPCRYACKTLFLTLFYMSRLSVPSSGNHELFQQNMIAVIQLISWNINTVLFQKMMHYRNVRNFTAMLSHPAYLFLQGSQLCSVFLQVPVCGATCWRYVSGTWKRRTWKNNTWTVSARTDKFISAVKPFYRSKEQRA